MKSYSVIQSLCEVIFKLLGFSRLILMQQLSKFLSILFGIIIFKQYVCIDVGLNVDVICTNKSFFLYFACGS